MRKGTRRAARFTVGRSRALMSAMLIVGLVAGLTTSASAGAGDPTATLSKKKCKKKKKAASAKKKKCAPATPVPPVPPGPTTLSVTPTDFTFPDTQHGQESDPQSFTVTDTGGRRPSPHARGPGTKNPIPAVPPAARQARAPARLLCPPVAPARSASGYAHQQCRGCAIQGRASRDRVSRSDAHGGAYRPGGLMPALGVAATRPRLRASGGRRPDSLECAERPGSQPDRGDVKEHVDAGDAARRITRRERVSGAVVGRCQAPIEVP